MPMSTSTVPFAKSARSSRCCLGVRNRLSTSTRTPKGAKRSRKVSRCCWARIVVGQSTITCRPSCTHLKAARSATSVFPNPTSPQRRRSIGLGSSMSALMSAMALSRSPVSAKGKLASMAACSGVSLAKAWPVAWERRA